jgi:hypothetical protein
MLTDDVRSTSSGSKFKPSLAHSCQIQLVLYPTKTLKEGVVYRYVSATEWVSGSNDGSVALWSQLKKKPVSLQKAVHRGEAGGASPGCVDGDAVSWVQSLATCPGGDLVVGLCPPSFPIAARAMFLKVRVHNRSTFKADYLLLLHIIVSTIVLMYYCGIVVLYLSLLLLLYVCF